MKALQSLRLAYSPLNQAGSPSRRMNSTDILMTTVLRKVIVVRYSDPWLVDFYLFAFPRLLDRLIVNSSLIISLFLRSAKAINL
jgi:hypothetical protein